MADNMNLVQHVPANPLNQNLILKLVLEHVGTSSITTLKNCRLVNHSWNKIAVKVLEKLGFAAHLDFDRMLKFRTSLKKTRRNQGLQELYSLRLSLKAIVAFRVEINDFGILTYVSELLVINPRLRVSFINFIWNIAPAVGIEEGVNFADNAKLFSLLNAVSSTIISITFSYGHVMPCFEEFNFDNYQFLTFPKLKSIQYEVHYDEEQPTNIELDLTRHVISILQRASVSKLHLNIWEGGAERTATSVETMIRISASNLEELLIKEVGIPNLETFKPLADLKFPRLRRIILVDGLLRNNEWINNCLKNNCPALTDLEVDWPFQHNIYDVIEFPILPNIRNLRLHLAYFNRSGNYLGKVHQVFTTLLMKLPSLTALYTDLGLLMMLGVYSQRENFFLPADKYLQFPNIETLNVNILTRDWNSDIRDEARLTSRIYLHTFPNLRKIVIKPDNGILGIPNSMDKERIEIANKFLCCHPSIETIEVHNYAQAWMDRVFKVKKKFEGIKSLTLLAPEKTRRGQGARINLMELVTKFPALEHLQYGREISSGSDLQQARDLAKKFFQPISD